MPLNKDLVAASATPLVLAILKREDSYGYAIIAAIRGLSGGQMEWAEGMLYPILHRLEKKGQIESYWGKADTGRRRKYYRLLPAGVKELNQYRRHWKDIQGMLSQLDGAQ